MCGLDIEMLKEANEIGAGMMEVIQHTLTGKPDLMLNRIVMVV